ncbi:MAG: dephospho-CoA kinase [Acidobacteriota bacterium]|nr:dephospho-CoA kinase [Acidobacteriota bacterium]
MTPLLVGLTGGLASGKSTVAELLAEAGCLVVDADRLVAELYASGGEGARAVAAIAGEELLADDGSVDRRLLAARMFQDDPLRAAVEAAVHPLVRRRFRELSAASETPIVVLEATLLVEAGYGPDFDVVVTVEADGDRRLRRAIARGLSEDQARARLAAQGGGAARRAAADVVLENDGSLDELRKAVADLVASLGDRLEAKTGRRAESRK